MEVVFLNASMLCNEEAKIMYWADGDSELVAACQGRANLFCSDESWMLKLDVSDNDLRAVAVKCGMDYANAERLPIAQVAEAMLNHELSQIRTWLVKFKFKSSGNYVSSVTVEVVSKDSEEAARRASKLLRVDSAPIESVIER